MAIVVLLESNNKEAPNMVSNISNPKQEHKQSKMNQGFEGLF